MKEYITIDIINFCKKSFRKLRELIQSSKNKSCLISFDFFKLWRNVLRLQIKNIIKQKQNTHINYHASQTCMYLLYTKCPK